MSIRNLFLSVALILATTMGLNASVINEFEPNPSGTDPSTQDVELLGTPSAPYSGWLLSIEMDGAGGTIDRATEVSGTYDANGLSIETIGDLENPGFTLVFSELDAGGLGTDLDTDNDGVLDDPSVFGTVFDAVSVPDDATDSGYYAGQLGGVDFMFTGGEPELTFRERSTGTWIAVNDLDDPLDGIFGADGTEYFASDFRQDPFVPTFGSANPEFVPEPASAITLGLGALALLFARRRR